MFNDKYRLTQAVLEGIKTQTRRLIKANNLFDTDKIEDYTVFGDEIQIIANNGESCITIKSIYTIGEIVSIAQSYKNAGINFIQCDLRPKHHHIWGYTCNMRGWNNKMFVQAEVMPHQIEITNIRIERIQDISDDDCLAEGIRKGVCGSADTHFMEAYYLPIPYEPYTTPKEAYSELIDKICGKGTWDRNPYVFVYDFELLR